MTPPIRPTAIPGGAIPSRQESQSKKKIPDVLSHLLQHPSSKHWNKREVEEGLRVLKESLSNSSLSCDSYQKVHTLAVELLQLNKKNGGKYIAEKEKALLEHISIASQVRSSPELPTKEETEKLLAQFQTTENKTLLARWEKAGIDPLAFLYNPLESRFLLTSHLTQAATYWGHDIRFDPKEKSILMFIEGAYSSITPFMNSVAIRKKQLLDSSGFHRDILTDKKDPSKVWVYMPDKGLTLHNPADWEKLPVAGHLAPEEVEYARGKALLHAENGENGEYVIEIVSSWNKPKGGFISSGAQEILSGEHPWLRIIEPDGTLYCVGFHPGAKLPAPTGTTMGAFLAPDPKEPFDRTGRIVTGIKVTKEQCQALIQRIEKDQEKKVDFNFIEQNCTRFMQSVVDSLHIDTPIQPIFFTPVSDLVYRAIPTGIRNGFKTVKRVFTPIGSTISEFTPPVVQKIFQSIGIFLRMLVEQVVLFFSGKELFYINKREIKIKTEDPHKGIPWYKLITHFNIAAENRLVKAFLPIKVVEWQMQLRGTRIYPSGTSFHNQYLKQPMK